MVDAAAKLGGPTIAAGGGVTEENVAALLRASGVDEVHGSCRELVRSAMRHRPAQPVPMGGERRNTADSEFEWKQASERRVQGLVLVPHDERAAWWKLTRHLQVLRAKELHDANECQCAVACALTAVP